MAADTTAVTATTGGPAVVARASYTAIAWSLAAVAAEEAEDGLGGEYLGEVRPGLVPWSYQRR